MRSLLCYKKRRYSLGERGNTVLYGVRVRDRYPREQAWKKWSEEHPQLAPTAQAWAEGMEARMKQRGTQIRHIAAETAEEFAGDLTTRELAEIVEALNLYWSYGRALYAWASRSGLLR